MNKTKAQINKREKERKKIAQNKISIKMNHTKTGSSLQGVFAASKVDVAGGSTQGEGGLGALAHDLHAVGVAERRGGGAASTILLVVRDVVLRVLAVVEEEGLRFLLLLRDGRRRRGGVVPLDPLHCAYAPHEHGHFLLVGGAELLEGGAVVEARISAMSLVQTDSASARAVVLLELKVTRRLRAGR